MLGRPNNARVFRIPTERKAGSVSHHHTTSRATANVPKVSQTSHGSRNAQTQIRRIRFFKAAFLPYPKPSARIRPAAIAANHSRAAFWGYCAKDGSRAIAPAFGLDGAYSYPQRKVQILFNFKFRPIFINKSNVLQPAFPSKGAV